MAKNSSKDNKKKQKNKVKVKSEQAKPMSKELKGILIIASALIILLSLCSSVFSGKESLTGLIGVFIYELLIGTIGITAYILPLILVFIGISYISKGGVEFTKKFYGIVLFIINTVLLIQMISLQKYYIEGNLSLSIAGIYKSSSILHGGAVGYLITLPIYKLFGSIGSYIIFITIYILSIILIKNITAKELIDSIKVLINNVSSREGKKKKTSISENTIIKDNIEVDEKVAVTEDISLDNPFFNLDNKKNDNSDESKIKIIEFLKEEDKNCDTTDFSFKEDKEQLKPHLNNYKSVKDDKKEDFDEMYISDLNQNTFKNYQYPDVEFLYKNDQSQLKKGDKKDLLNSASKLQETLQSFGVEAKVTQVTKGPSVTRFELQPSAGVKVSKIVNLADDIALNLAASGVRIEAPIPGKAAVGIEVPNKELSAVYLREVIESDVFKEFNKNLAFCLGKDIAGKAIVSDLTKMPHLLVAGATGSGKSVCINTLLMSILYKYSPEDVKLLLIDPKVVELNVYNGIPHLLIPVVTDPKKAAGALNWAVNEMTRRYKIFADNGVRNVEGYNELVSKGIVEEKLPWIIIIIDELADLMMVCPNDVEDYIGRLAQMARAAGMHLVIATQRPSVDVITGVIKANIPSRISFAVSSQIDSRTILDSSGAEKLLGKGDMLFYPVGEAKPLRIQGAFVSEEEVERVIGFIKNQIEEHTYSEEIIEKIEEGIKPSQDDDCDELLNQAIQIVIEENQASTSMLQRRLKIGYNRAARIIDQMEERGVISGRNGSKPRQVLISHEDMEK